jgi:hypothetical protein
MGHKPSTALITVKQLLRQPQSNVFSFICIQSWSVCNPSITAWTSYFINNIFVFNPSVTDSTSTMS